MRTIALTRGYIAIVDDEDHDRLAVHKWSALVNKHAVYAKRTVQIGAKRRTLLLHREILGLPPDRSVDVDHIDGDSLDCRRANLRQCSRSQNLLNQAACRGHYRGVRREPTGRFAARLTVNRQAIWLGAFETAEQAALAWDEGAKMYHGEFARLNFPNGLPAVAAASEPNETPEMQGPGFHVSDNGDATWENLSTRTGEPLPNEASQ